MAVPKQKTSRARSLQRENCKFIRGVHAQICACGALKLSHNCCLSCMNYNGLKLNKRSKISLEIADTTWFFIGKFFLKYRKTTIYLLCCLYLEEQLIYIFLYKKYIPVYL